MTSRGLHLSCHGRQDLESLGRCKLLPECAFGLGNSTSLMLSLGQERRGNGRCPWKVLTSFSGVSIVIAIVSQPRWLPVCLL